MNPILSTLSLRALLSLAILVGGFGLGGCTTTDPSPDTMVYPTPAEKNQQMQERMSQVTRTLM